MNILHLNINMIAWGISLFILVIKIINGFLDYFRQLFPRHILIFRTGRFDRRPSLIREILKLTMDLCGQFVSVLDIDKN